MEVDARLRWPWRVPFGQSGSLKPGWIERTTRGAGYPVTTPSTNRRSNGGGALIVAALGDISRAYGMGKLAEDTGLSREGLSKALSPRGNPSFSTVLEVTRALGVRFTTVAA